MVRVPLRAMLGRQVAAVKAAVWVVVVGEGKYAGWRWRWAGGGEEVADGGL